MLRKNQERARKNRQKKAKKTETSAQKAAKAKVDTKKAFSGKSLMGGTGLVSGKGPVKSGKTYGELLKKNKKEDAGGPKGVLAPKPMKKKKAPTPPTKPSKPVSRGGTYGKPLPSNPQLKSQAGGSGTYGKPLPSNPKLKTQPRDPESGVSLTKPSAATKVKTHSDGSQTKVVGGKRYTRPNKNAPWKKG